jgi:hypothetical protein
MNTPITLSECVLTSLAHTFTDEESFSAFGKNKLSKLYNLYSVSLGAKHGFGNLIASCKFRPHHFIPEQIDLLEVARRVSVDSKSLDSVLPFTHLYYDITSNVELVTQLTREYMLCAYVTQAYKAIKRPNDQYSIVDAWFKFALRLYEPEPTFLAINAVWGSIDIDGDILGEILEHSDLVMPVDKNAMMSFIDDTPDPIVEKCTDEQLSTLKRFFSQVTFNDFAHVLLTNLSKGFSNNIKFDAKAFVVNNLGTSEFIGMRCLDNSGRLEIDYKLFKEFIVMCSPNICLLADVNIIQHDTISKIMTNTRISDKERATRIGDIYVSCLKEGISDKAAIADWQMAIVKFKTKYLGHYDG